MHIPTVSFSSLPTESETLTLCLTGCPTPGDLKTSCQARLHLRLTKRALKQISGVWDQGTMLFKMLQVILSAAPVDNGYINPVETAFTSAKRKL